MIDFSINSNLDVIPYISQSGLDRSRPIWTSRDRSRPLLTGLDRCGPDQYGQIRSRRLVQTGPPLQTAPIQTGKVVGLVLVWYHQPLWSRPVYTGPERSRPVVPNIFHSDSLTISTENAGKYAVSSTENYAVNLTLCTIVGRGPAMVYRKILKLKRSGTAPHYALYLIHLCVPLVQWAYRQLCRSFWCFCSSNIQPCNGYCMSNNCFRQSELLPKHPE